MGAWRKLLLIALILGVCGLVRSEGDSGANAKKNPRNETIPGPAASPPQVAPSDAKREDPALTDSGATNVTASTGGSENSGTKDEKQPDVKKDEQDAGKKDEQATMNEGKGHCCETTSKVLACLSSPGDASNGILSLIVTSRNSAQVEITTPEFLSADPSTFTTESGKDVSVRIEIVDPEAAKQKNSTIKIKSDGECELEVPFKNLGYEDGTGLSYSTLRTPLVGFSMLAAALVLVLGSWAYCRYRAKKSRHGETSEDTKYVELEMGLYDPNNPTASTAADDKNWDEGWDEDWDDSQFKLSKSLSAKGLASRRTAIDGWAD